ncbi:hypothetical protein KC19_3G183600 [Ceratodon purpureus]|uniref:Nicotinate phosphoribosyltransferase n=1 Tax=Ceratodon purpureus TaxID=3225 RepID=A0A8T0INR1_CERPU|nr:hypothetical protein KC19_3G183600 [Ceratodon purpureus]
MEVRETEAKRDDLESLKENGGGGGGGGRGGESCEHGGVIAPPTNPMVSALLTDMYQISMAYAYWKVGKHQDRAVFDLLYRKNPFGGEYTGFAGLEECIRFAANFKFTDDDIDSSCFMHTRRLQRLIYLESLHIPVSFVELLFVASGLANSIPGNLSYIRVAQLLETTFLTMVNYASLVASNAARHRRVVGKDKMLLEFGLRRAQAGISAWKYCYLGGFDATSNVDAGRRFGIPVRGTHSHAFVSAFMSFDEITERSLAHAKGGSKCEDFVHLTQSWLSRMQESPTLRKFFHKTNYSELAAFTSYALAFPTAFQALVDTYDVMKSGILNFCAVALALHELGYKALGIRLDSGDLSYFSCEAWRIIRDIEKEFNVPGFGKLVITASNNINEETLDALNKQGHEIDAFGIGTHLVTCFSQPALGCVYKLVEISGQPRIKRSEDLSKVTIPCKKQAFRLYGREGVALMDLLIGESEPDPKALYKCYWTNDSGRRTPLPTLMELRKHCLQQLAAMRTDHMRALNSTPYKVSVSGKLYDFIHFLWLNEAPVGELQ